MTRLGTVRASRPLMGWRTIDLLTCAFIGVAFGVIFWGWDLVYEAPSTAISAGFPPLGALLTWPWLLAGLVGGLVVRRPGAALFTELIGGIVEMLIGSKFGFGGFLSGLIQGLGAEIGFALFAYASFGALAVGLAGAISGAVEAIYEWFAYYPDWDLGYRVAYLLLLAGSTALIGGAVALAIVGGLARAGALRALPPGQEQRERHAV